MQNCCKNCHFLAKENVNDAGHRGSSTWSAQERSDLHVKDYWAAKCVQGIWDTGIDPHLNSRLREILEKDRGDDCFFIETQDGMSFQAATALHKIRSENKNLKKSYRYTQIGLWIAAISLFLNLFYSILKDFI